ncbi:lytic transglycosylase domain-containing protein [Aeromicrobium phragmitis]|uniref:lytic transglycosylase domain-containing protein n=1 Tax=Aeromicrobium phragmitis TaxID=2478914 RepID=UPI00105BF385|nr:lytic murein transglycosylase [Aeromicrobium phragmitis]
MSNTWRSLPRWQRVAAAVPATLLIGATAVAVTGPGLASADGEYGPIPKVPDTAFEEPASVEKAPAGIDPKAGAEGTLASLDSDGIPQVAHNAYRRAAGLLGQADKACNLPWHLVAAIGRVESDHGRVNGNSLDSDGNAKPGIYGVPLNGKNGVALIRDTDQGTLDKDTEYDRAVGPMQFIPTTWKSVGIDADQNGEKNPQNIHDAATAAAIYLCAGDGDLSARDDAAAAVKRYNNSDEYVELVLKISDAYSKGNFTTMPTGSSRSSILTSYERDQTMTPAERAKAAEQARQRAEQQQGGGGDAGGPAAPTPGQQPGKTPGGSGGGGGGTGGSGGDGGTPGGGGDGTPGGGGGAIPPTSDGKLLGGATGPVTGGLEDATGGIPVVGDVVGGVGDAVDTVVAVIDHALARLLCAPAGLGGKYHECVNFLVGKPIGTPAPIR